MEPTTAPLGIDLQAIWPIALATVMAAVPLYAVLRGRTFGAPPPLSVGRHAIFFAAIFGASLLGLRFATAGVVLVVYAIGLFALALPRGRQAVLRLVVGRDWAARNYETITNQASLVFIPLASIAIASILFGALWFYIQTRLPPPPG